jgi:hypothetical protein
MKGEQQGNFWRDSEGDAASVDPADLRAVWKMMRDTGHKLGPQTSIDYRSFERVCSPGANVQAVWYRASMLAMLSKALPGFEPKDASFEIAASFPMKKMEVGVVYNEPPFNLQEFMKRVAEAGNA